MFSYTVAATFIDPAVADEWIAWLRNEHLAEVLASGALDAEVLQCDPPPESPPSPAPRCEVRYHFPSREAFLAYERDHAPRLRAAGLALFPPTRGITYHRATATIAHTATAVAGRRPAQSPSPQAHESAKPR